MNAVDDGLVNGNLDLADVLFLIAMVCFLVEAVLRLAKRPILGILVPLGLAALALGFLVL